MVIAPNRPAHWPIHPEPPKERPTMKTNSPAQPNLLETGSIKIEWNWDFEDLIDLGDFGPGNAGRATLKGRCKRCWGKLLGRVDETGALTGIRCRVCGASAHGQGANAEYKQMSHEGTFNMLNMGLGHLPRYEEDSRFVLKVFPEMVAQPEEQFLKHVKAKAVADSKLGWLNRSDFPAGSVGYFLLQAKVLISGVERTPREMTVARFPDFDPNDDGSVTVRFSKKELGEHSTTHESEFMKRMGSTMTVAMMSAFACELAMKAIRLTRMDEARKSHDLIQLYNDLPVDSRKRVEADCPEIITILERGRHTFGRWRYFETNVGKRGFVALIDSKRALGLGKAARVLLDEAEMVGLGCFVRLKARQRVREDGDERVFQYDQRLKVGGYEAPPLTPDGRRG